MNDDSINELLVPDLRNNHPPWVEHLRDIKLPRSDWTYNRMSLDWFTVLPSAKDPRTKYKLSFIVEIPNATETSWPYPLTWPSDPNGKLFRIEVDDTIVQDIKSRRLIIACIIFLTLCIVASLLPLFIFIKNK